MPNIEKAEEVFKEIPDKIKSKIFAAAEGKLVYFPKKNERARADKERVIETYLKSKGITYKKIGEQFNLTAARICQIIREEKTVATKERIDYWHREKGISLRRLGEFYKRSAETIRQQCVKGGDNEHCGN